VRSNAILSITRCASRGGGRTAGCLACGGTALETRANGAGRPAGLLKKSSGMAPGIRRGGWRKRSAALEPSAKMNRVEGRQTKIDSDFSVAATGWTACGNRH
jgi:hypothetical protein